MDWTVYKGSRIAALPGVIRMPALLARNLKTGFNRRFRPLAKYHHFFDSIATRHNDGFRQTPRFKAAEARADKAGGWHFGIPYRLHQALWCADVARAVDGDFVELGTGRGYLMSAVLTDFPGWATSGRKMHLFDTFSPHIPDSEGAQSDDTEVSPHYATSYEDVLENFSEWPNVVLHRGDVFKTLEAAKLTKVAFASVDMNFAAAEVYGLRHLWPLMPKGGVVLLDDYAHGDVPEQYAALNELAAELGMNILSTPTGQGIIIKQ